MPRATGQSIFHNPKSTGRAAKLAIAIAAFAGLSACDHDPDSVLFVTSTTAGITVSAAPQQASIALDRIEGYIAPSYANGALPPVAALFDSDSGWFTSEIRQVYATGDAATKLTAQNTVTADDKPLLSDTRNSKKPALVGTATTIGAKVAFENGIGTNFLTGYRRQEFSFIPLGTQATEAGQVDVYPSVLASFDSSDLATTPQGTKFDRRQFFATGKAAENLAGRPDIKGPFNSSAVDAMTHYRANMADQKAATLSIAKCSIDVPDDKLDDIIHNAMQNGAIHDTEAAVTLLDNYKTEIVKPITAGRQANMAYIKRLYIADISITDGMTKERIAALKKHNEFVCKQSTLQT